MSNAGNQARLRGRVRFDHYRNGAKIATYEFNNGIVDVGLNHILECEFNGGTQVSTWYLGLINNSGFSALANADTMASHGGWTETADYDEATRPEWTAGTAASRAITNSSTVDFTMNATVTVRGVFVTTNNTKSGSTGTLWATANFGSPIALLDNDVLRVTYSISG
jgi:hypothetical protein